MPRGLGVRRAAVVVGRESELEQLLRAVRSVRAGEKACILLVGEGGVGKTRLLGEAAATGRQLGIGVLTARSPITTPVAFSVIAEALRSWLRGHPSEPTRSPFDHGLRLVLPEWPTNERAPELSVAQVRLLALEGIVHLVREIAATNDGVVVLLDDLHAADPESLEAVRYLATAAIKGAVIVGALRAGEASLPDELVRALDRDGVADVVEVNALDERAVTDLVAALLDADPPEPLVADIMARTDGIPLLVEEVLDAHVRAGSVEVGAAGTVWRGGTVAVPKTIRGMVEARMERLSRAQRDVLVGGAVLGDFEPALIADVADADARAVNDALTGGIEVGLLETTGGVIGFRHAVIREAVLDATIPHVIEAMHRRAANALDDGERRAQHLIAVGEFDDAARLLVRAAETCTLEHALLAAERAARAALDVGVASETCADAADALARSLAAQGRWLEALDIDGTTVAQHGETPARRHRMANCALEAGRPELAGPIIARALDAGDTSPFIHIAAGRAAIVTGDAERALAYAERVLEAASTEDDVDARLQALELKGRAFDYLGDRAAAEAVWTRQAEEAEAAGRTQAQLRAVVQLGKVELFAGRRPARLIEAVELAQAAGALVELAWAEENLSVGLGLHGEIEAGMRVLDNAIQRCRELRLDQLAYLIAHRGIASSFVGGDSEAWFREAEALLPTADLRLHTSGMRGDIAMREGRYEDAVRWFEECNQIMQNMPGVVPLDTPCWLVWALAAAGRPDDAAAALDVARAMPDLARWYSRPVLVAAADALLARDEDGVDAAIAATTAHMPFDVAQMRIVGAETLKGPAQTRWLREALDIYEQMGMTATADRARRLLREAGGPVPRRRRKTDPVPAELAAKGVTAREAEVLQLVGEGLSNPDIAQRLYLSVRTVETHVSSLLQKLEARSRGQLTALSASIDYATHP